VESGEGIESRLVPRLELAYEILWNPEKELKGPIVKHNRHDHTPSWNPEKELKVTNDTSYPRLFIIPLVESGEGIEGTD